MFFSGLISGVLFGLFSGQPLILLGSTGPVYVFEKLMYEMCKENAWDYLSLRYVHFEVKYIIISNSFMKISANFYFRLWIGLWVAVILCALVALDASAYVCYITR